jgi:glycerol-3-phosphate acyltransferase PlsX
VVIKSHGSADAYAFGKALERAAEEVRNDVIQRISQRMTQMQPASPAAQAVGE